MTDINLKGRCWTEISASALRNNYEIYKSMLPDNMEVMAVVKADAYGHGDQGVARLLAEAGCDRFAVSNVQEAMRLRQAGITGQILILGYTPPQLLPVVAENDITQAVLSEEYAKYLAEADCGIKCHFVIDTGMNRIGLDADDPAYCENVIRAYSRKLCVTGMFTHLCVADSDSAEDRMFTKTQIEKFKTVAEAVKDLDLSEIHCMNSAGGLWQAPYGAWARLGIILYGLKPDYVNQLPEGIQPALEWKSVVSMVKKVYPGEDIGYGRSYHADRERIIATVPTGYADGYSRHMSNKGYVLINGCRAPITGRVCMDQMMVDVTEIPDVTVGTVVTLLGRSGDEIFTADDMAHIIGSIGYEVVCDISKRVERFYLD